MLLSFASARVRTISPVRPSSTRPRTVAREASSVQKGEHSSRPTLVPTISTLVACAALSASPALARTVEIAIDANAVEQSSCGMAGGVPGSGTYKAKCIALKFTATNPSKEVVYNADVFGSVKDQANDEVLNSGRIGAIKELQPGVNEVRLEITAGANQPLPLRLKAFKARGTTEKLTMSGNPYDYEDVLAYDSY